MLWRHDLWEQIELIPANFEGADAFLYNQIVIIREIAS